MGVGVGVGVGVYLHNTHTHTHTHTHIFLLLPFLYIQYICTYMSTYLNIYQYLFMYMYCTVHCLLLLLLFFCCCLSVSLCGESVSEQNGGQNFPSVSVQTACTNITTSLGTHSMYTAQLWWALCTYVILYTCAVMAAEPLLSWL